MAERVNGKSAYVRRNHGSERRGVFPVPSADTVGYQREQSLRDKARLQEQMRQRFQRPEVAEVDRGLGNKELPAFAHKQEIIQTLEHTRAMILGGETGSGKSTQVPQFLYEAGYDKIFVLVPRRVIADGLGERIREEMVGQLGEAAENLVGIIHGERVETHDDNRIVVMTPDTFNGMERDLQRLYKDKKVAIMSDEIHEANLFTEIATGVAAMAVQDNENWRLIAASATHNTETLMKPFGRINGNGEVPVVTIEGRPFTIEQQEEPDKTPMEVYATLDELPDRSMIFTSGKKEIQYIIDQTRDELEKREPGLSQKVIFRKLHGELSEVELSHINDPVPEGYRLVVVSSPAGMSGITISGMTHVITDGTINRSELDDDGVGGLRRQYLSRAGIMQQMGRAGRDVAGGIGILAKPITIEEDKLRLRNQVMQTPQMPFKDFNDTARSDHEPAEIYHSNLGRVVLRVAGLDRRFSDINEYIPHRVAQSAIIGAEESLFRLGALDDEDTITTIGRQMNKFSLSPELSRGVAEAYRNNRPIQHMAHVAIIAASVEQGGLQDFSSKTSHWRKFLRPTTDDDFIAQLDMSMAIMDQAREFGPENEQYFFYMHDLHPKKIERARKAARKILKTLKIDMNNLELMPPRFDDEALLRTDFTAGMIDLVYEETSRRQKKTYYRSIHGDNSSTERYITRSITKPPAGAIVAGFPRWFEKVMRTGSMQHHDVLEQILTIKEEDVKRFATEHGILTSRMMTPRIEGDVVVELEQKMFGSLEVGKPTSSAQREYIPEATKNLIIKSALERHGEAQQALRAIIEELAHYRKTIPAEELTLYRKSNAPEDITHHTIESLVRGYAKETRSLSQIDRRLAQYVYSSGISINRYYDNQARVELQSRSPEQLNIAGHETRIHYDKGQPYITHLSREQRDYVSEGIFLPDGREVLLQIARKEGKWRVSLLANAQSHQVIAEV